MPLGEESPFKERFYSGVWNESLMRKPIFIIRRLSVVDLRVPSESAPTSILVVDREREGWSGVVGTNGQRRLRQRRREYRGRLASHQCGQGVGEV